MRIAGLASGLDVDSIVKELMSARRQPLNKLNQQKTLLEWQREQYREINIKLVDLRNNKLFNYGLDSAINAKKITVTVSGGDAVSAKASTGSTPGTITIEAQELATTAYARSVTGIGNVDTSKTLAELKTAGIIDYTTDGSGNIAFEINGEPITLNENTDTLATMVSKINSSAANVNVFFDSNTGKMSISSKQTGAGSIVLDDLTSGFLANFDLTDTKAGTDARVIINGIETTRSSNIFSVNGVEITLKAQSPTGVATTINVVETRDTDKIFETIKSFINDYNEVLSAINGKLNEERYRSYEPLTSDQKKEMSEDEIKLWEEKAKSGLLRRDSTLTTLASDMRLATMTDVRINGNSFHLNSIGIETGTYDQRGKLIIKDEAKLRQAIEANPDEVLKLFTQKTSETDPTKKGKANTPDSGLFERLSNVIATALDSLAQKAGTSRVSTDPNSVFSADSTMGEQLRSLENRISDLSARLITVENNYYKQFAAMEAAISRYSAQASNLFNS